MSTTILFPTDYSSDSNSTLRHAVSLARQSAASLLVVHVKPPAAVAPAEPREDTDDALQEELLKLLTSVTGDQAAVSHDFVLAVGDPATEIVRIARERQADLIVMATAGRTGLRRLLMGSVAAAVMQQAPCPVLTVKHPRKLRADQKLTVKALGEETMFRPADDGPPGERAQPAAKAHFTSAVALIARAVESRATDIHLDPFDGDAEVRFRIDGRLEPIGHLDGDLAHSLITQLKVMASVDIADPFHPSEGHITLGEPLAGYEVRLTRVPVVGGDSLALRILDRQRVLRPLDGLGLSAEGLERLHAILRLGEGLVLITGPTGSGKTTTAYSMIHAVDDSHRNIVTIEDPVEYRVPGFRQMAVDIRHGVTMTSGLRSLLRMDPDVVLVGEIRDAETAEIAMRAASAGKYVFSTLHTRDVASTITALRDLHIDNRSLAGNLTGIISQRLVRRVCPHCRLQSALDESQKRMFSDHGLNAPAEVPTQGRCPQCGNSGYHGRTGVFEVAVSTRDSRGDRAGRLGGRAARFVAQRRHAQPGKRRLGEGLRAGYDARRGSRHDLGFARRMRRCAGPPELCSLPKPGRWPRAKFPSLMFQDCRARRDRRQMSDTARFR